MGHSEIYMRVRTESFVSARWPGRPFLHTESQPVAVPETSLLHRYWIAFTDDQLPRAVGLMVDDPEEPDPVFTVVEVHAIDEARVSRWCYWTHLGWQPATR